VDVHNKEIHKKMPFIRKETINKQEMILSGGQGMLYNARDCIESANIFIF